MTEPAEELRAAVVPVEFLYAIEAGHFDSNDEWVAARVVSLRITKKTLKRIYYVSRDWGPRPPIRCVDRQQIETDGEIRPRSRQWFEPDVHLYLAPPAIDKTAKPDLAQLKAAMAAAHPDRGGTVAEFIAARDRYERARGINGHRHERPGPGGAMATQPP